MEPDRIQTANRKHRELQNAALKAARLKDATFRLFLISQTQAANNRRAAAKIARQNAKEIAQNAD